MNKIKLSDFAKLNKKEMIDWFVKCKNNSVNRTQLIQSVDKPNYTIYEVWNDQTCFNIIDDHNGWEFVNYKIDMVTVYKDKLDTLDNLSYIYNCICFKKTSKFGEILFIKIDDRYGTPNVHVNSFGKCAKDNNYPIVVLDENINLNHFFGLPIKYYEYTEELRQYNSQHLNTIENFVIFPHLPSLDISITEYADELEQYAKYVRDNTNLYHKEHETNYTRINGIKRLKKYTYALDSDMQLSDVDFIIYMSLKYLCPELTIETYNKLFAMVDSDMKSIQNFILKCKKEYLKKYDFGNMPNCFNTIINIYTNDCSSGYDYIFKSLHSINLDILSAMLNKIKDIESMNIDKIDSSKILKKVTQEYDDELKVISDDFGMELSKIYREIVKAVTNIEKKYNGKIKDAGRAIIKKYPEINLSDTIYIEDYIDLSSSLKKSLKFIRDEAYSVNDDASVFNKMLNLDKMNKTVKKHIDEIFKLMDNPEPLTLLSIHKSEDSPYELIVINEFDLNNTAVVDQMLEKMSKKEMNKWIDKFETFDFSNKLCEDNCKDLYPGQIRKLVLNPDYTFDLITVS